MPEDNRPPDGGEAERLAGIYNRAMTSPLSGIEAVEREMRVHIDSEWATKPKPEPDRLFVPIGEVDKWAARLKAERERLQKLLDPDPRIEVIEPYDFRLYAAMEQLRRNNLERERLEPFLKAAKEHFEGRWNYSALIDAYRAVKEKP